MLEYDSALRTNRRRGAKALAHYIRFDKKIGAQALVLNFASVKMIG